MKKIKFLKIKCFLTAVMMIILSSTTVFAADYATFEDEIAEFEWADDCMDCESHTAVMSIDEYINEGIEAASSTVCNLLGGCIPGALLYPLDVHLVGAFNMCVGVEKWLVYRCDRLCLGIYRQFLLTMSGCGSRH